jgi:hypothetical protein
MWRIGCAERRRASPGPDGQPVDCPWKTMRPFPTASPLPDHRTARLPHTCPPANPVLRASGLLFVDDNFPVQNPENRGAGESRERDPKARRAPRVPAACRSALRRRPAQRRCCWRQVVEQGRGPSSAKRDLAPSGGELIALWRARRDRFSGQYWCGFQGGGLLT